MNNDQNSSPGLTHDWQAEPMPAAEAPVKLAEEMTLPVMMETPKRRNNIVGIVASVMVFAVLAGGLGVGLYLTKQKQLTAPKATGEGGCTCTGAWTQSLTYCLLSCTQANGQLCYAAGTISKCGDKYNPNESEDNYCKPTGNSCTCFCCRKNGQNGSVTRLNGKNCSTSCISGAFDGETTNPLPPACQPDVATTPPAASACLCGSWDADGCGVDCQFPADMQARVDAAAGACGSKVAVCHRNGNDMYVTIDDIDSANICMTPAKLAACHNPSRPGNCTTPTATPTPPSTAKKCDSMVVFKIMRGTQDVTAPTAAKIKVGDVVTFRAFPSTVGATVTQMTFTLKSGAELPNSEGVPVVQGATPYADYTTTISAAGSYSIKANVI